MRILFVLIPISLVLLGIAIAAFVWAVKKGQFEDLDTPPLDILVDDDQNSPISPQTISSPLSKTSIKNDAH